MADLSTFTFGFSKTATNYSLAPTKFYSSGSPQSQIVYLFKDSSNNYHVGSYNSTNANVSSCPTADNILTISSSSDFDSYKSYYSKYGVDTSSWSYDYSVGTYSIYFDAALDSENWNAYTYSVDISNMHIVPRSDVSSMCSSVVSNASYYLVANSTFSISDSGSSSDNYNDLISAILMIPATIICLACMSVIYKMFMSRKLRGE